MTDGENGDLAEQVPVPSVPLAVEDRLDRLESVLANHLAEMRAFSRDALRQAHDETTRLREAAALGGMRPLFNELLAIHDDLSRLIAFYGAGGHAEPHEVVENLEGIRTQLDEAFARRGVVSLTPTVGQFDRDTHRAVQVEPVADPAADLVVLREVRPGFVAPGGVVRRTDVIIARYQPGPALKPQDQERT